MNGAAAAVVGEHAGCAIRAAVPADRDAALRLLGRAFGGTWPGSIGPELWQWLFLANPAGVGLRYLVADDDGRLAAQYAMLPVRMQHEGRRVLGLLSLHTATDPDYARRGLFVALASRLYASAADEAPIVYGFPNRESAPGFASKLGWTELAPFPLLAAPLPAAARLPAGSAVAAIAGHGAGAAGRALQAALAVRARPLCRRGFAVAPFDEFGPWADALWGELAPRLGTCAVRDAAFLGWRFCASPYAYRRTLLLHGGEPVGFAVVGHAPWHGATLAYVMELLVRPSAGAGVPLLLHDALCGAAAAGAAAVCAIATPRHPQRGALLRAGLLPVPAPLRRGFAFGARANGPGADPASLLRIDGWHLSGADLDHV